MKIKLSVLIFVLVILIMSGCSRSIPAVITPLTDDEVKSYIVDNKIKEVVREKIGDLTVVLYKDDMAFGYHMLYKDKDGVIQDQMANASYLDGNLPPVFTSGVATGSNPFIAVYINDEELIKSASTIEVVLNDGSSVRKKLEGKGVIIPYSRESEKGVKRNSSHIVIYDEKESIIFSSGK
ncbi:hypothetical protein ACFQZE_14260 [Paenibacillus sp. GCM10027627]|uniref:hypothetical protein n=1 Tax=unclassified Paenibacillus TaxID=185978 RepID=UPI0036301DBA